MVIRTSSRSFASEQAKAFQQFQMTGTLHMALFMIAGLGLMLGARLGAQWAIPQELYLGGLAAALVWVSCTVKSFVRTVMQRCRAIHEVVSKQYWDCPISKQLVILTYETKCRQVAMMAWSSAFIPVMIYPAMVVAGFCSLKTTEIPSIWSLLVLVGLVGIVGYAACIVRFMREVGRHEHASRALLEELDLQN